MADLLVRVSMTLSCRHSRSGPGPMAAARKPSYGRSWPLRLLSPPRRNLADLLAAMPDVGVDADFQRQDEPAVAADVFD
jgi:antitoxin FitA